MRLILASSRGLISGWLISVTMPLLLSQPAIAAWSAAGLETRTRVGLACIELLGAALFAFERPMMTGGTLLLTAFMIATLIHRHIGKMPWWLAVYAIAVILLLCLTRRTRLRRCAQFVT